MGNGHPPFPHHFAFNLDPKAHSLGRGGEKALGTRLPRTREGNAMDFESSLINKI